MRCGFCKTKVSPRWFFQHIKKRKCPFIAWNEVMELRKNGQHDKADKKANILMGIKPMPMSDETKEKLRVYNETHKAEIKQKQKLKRIQKKILKQRLKGTKKLKRSKPM